MEKAQYLRENIETVETALEHIRNGCQQLNDSFNDSVNTATNIS